MFLFQNLKALSASITKLAEVANKTVLTQKQEQQQQQQQQQSPATPAEFRGEVERKQQQMKALQKAALKEKAEALRKEVRWVEFRHTYWVLRHSCNRARVPVVMCILLMWSVHQITLSCKPSVKDDRH